MIILELERRKRKWSQVGLGSRANVPPHQISWIETGRFTPYSPALERLAKALEFEGEPEDLLKEVAN